MSGGLFSIAVSKGVIPLNTSTLMSGNFFFRKADTKPAPNGITGILIPLSSKQGSTKNTDKFLFI